MAETVFAKPVAIDSKLSKTNFPSSQSYQFHTCVDGIGNSLKNSIATFRIYFFCVDKVSLLDKFEEIIASRFNIMLPINPLTEVF